MNDSQPTEEGYDYQFLIIVLNFIATVLTLLINSHQSYSNSSFKSECCGHELISVKKEKTKFGNTSDDV